MVTFGVGLFYIIFLISFLTPSMAYSISNRSQVPYNHRYSGFPAVLTQHGGCCDYVDYTVDIKEGPYPVAPKTYSLTYINLHFFVTGGDASQSHMKVICKIAITDGVNTVEYSKQRYYSSASGSFEISGSWVSALNLKLPETTRAVTITVSTEVSYYMAYGLIYVIDTVTSYL